MSFDLKLSTRNFKNVFNWKVVDYILALIGFFNCTNQIPTYIALFVFNIYFII